MGFWILKFWGLDFGILEFGVFILDSGSWILVVWISEF